MINKKTCWLNNFCKKLSLLLIALTVISCSTYGNNVAPIPLPSYQPGHITIDKVDLIARVYLDPNIAQKRFGFDIRGAGLVPVQIVIDNQSKKDVEIDPSQTFLIDRKGQAWPLLSAQEAYNRIKNYVQMGQTAISTVKPAALLGAAGALVGFAIGVVSGHNIGQSIAKGAVIGATAGALGGGVGGYSSVESKIRHDLTSKSLQNKAIKPGELAHGFLFFPGKKEELKSAHALRLAIKLGNQEKIVTLPLIAEK